MSSCSTCGVPLPDDGYATRRSYCSSICRVKAHRARVKVRQDLAFELLLMQTRAVQDGNAAQLRAIAALAERLLPRTS